MALGYHFLPKVAKLAVDLVNCWTLDLCRTVTLNPYLTYRSVLEVNLINGNDEFFSFVHIFCIRTNSQSCELLDCWTRDLCGTVKSLPNVPYRA